MFNFKTKLILSELFYSKRNLKIEGVNSIGQKFSITGKIAALKNGGPAIIEDCIYLDLGDGDFQEKRYCAPFYTKIENKNKNNLHILYMKEENGNVIFVNESCASIFSTCLQNGKNLIENWKDINNEFVKNALGKIVSINNNLNPTGILTAFYPKDDGYNVFILNSQKSNKVLIKDISQLTIKNNIREVNVFKEN